jgi:tetratricopeptide (TPR) repeat protein
MLLRDFYLTLSRFYSGVKNYDKSLDYLSKASEKLNEIKDANARYGKITDLNFRGNLFAAKNQLDLARKSFDEAILVADQLKYEPLKLTGYVNIFGMYLVAKQPAEALKYFKARPAIKEYFLANGMSSIVEQLYGYVYTDLNLLDSAEYFYKKSLPFFSQQLGNASKIQFYNNYARLQFKAKNYNEAIKLLNEAGTTAKQINDLEWQSKINKQLDSAYQLKGDYKTALFHSTAARLLQDSVDVLSKEADILQLQLADEDERRARLAKEEEESRNRRHQVQYYGITIGIAILFVLLVMLGTFRVSARTIRIVGFFTFLMLFEFIFLLLKKNFYAITNGEPWKDLAVMIGLAALLLPLHHAVEHKVIHYLTHKQLITIKKSKYFPTFLGKKLKPEVAEGSI